MENMKFINVIVVIFIRRKLSKKEVIIMGDSICYKCNYCYYLGIMDRHFCTLSDDGRSRDDLLFIENNCIGLKECKDFIQKE